MRSMGWVLANEVVEIGSPNRAAPEIEWSVFVDEERRLKWPERTVGKGYVAGVGVSGLMMAVVWLMGGLKKLVIMGDREATA